MPENLLLDTNAAIAILNGDPQIEAFLIQGYPAYVPIIVLGELYFGAEKSARKEENLRRVEEFASRRTILDCDQDTARWYGRIVAQLAAKGRMITPNDIWIAAVAQQHLLTVLTNDSHFDEIDSLSIRNWINR